MHDVAIVGAGPGGAATAHFLAQRGLDVLLLDRSEFPRDKTCGDGLTPRALRVLDAMGILDEVQQHGHAINGYEVVAPNGTRTTARISSEPTALVIRRHTLDHLILQRAIASGATFRKANVTDLEPTAEGVTLNGEVRARKAVVATGAATGLLTRCGILKTRPRAMLAARAYADGLPDGETFQLSFDGAPLPGYGWSFPLGNGVSNVGVGFMPTRNSQPTAVAFQRFVAQLGAASISTMKGYPIRVDFLHAPTYAQNTLLVGEAAGLVNPLTGEGIDYALESARIASEHLDTPEHYHATLHARFDKLFRFSEQVRDWYCKPPLLNLLVPLANRYPELRQLLASIVLGEREPRGYSPFGTLARLLVYLARRRSYA
jgi:geranylgeranyl reductase family protein